MTQLEPTFDHSPHIDHQRQLEGLFDILSGIAQRYAHTIPGGIFSLDEEAQEAVISKINPYYRFEFDAHPDIHGLPISATGAGMFYVSDLEGNIMGAERLSSDDLATGTITDVCILPTPSLECLADGSEEEIPVYDQVLSPVIILEGGVFKTDYDPAVGFQNEVSLSNFQTCLPLAHHLRFTAAPHQR